MLKRMTQRLQAQLRGGDTLARIGGDEFGLLLSSLERLDDLDIVCERLLTMIREPLEIGGERINVSASLGVTVYPLDDGDAATLVRHADMALYAAKDAGRDQYYMHTLALDDAMRLEMEVCALGERALREELFRLHYQPIVSSVGPVVGVEVLLRLQHPEKGLLYPSAFFPILDHPRLARPIGRFVLDAAMRQGAIWHQAGVSLRLSVNISSRHLLDARFLDDLREGLTKNPGLPPELIAIEITESAPLRDMARAQVTLTACRALGVRIAIDDFGTGHASLAYLHKLPVNSIKIDQAFVRDMINDPKDLAIVASLITGARMLGLEVTAEGVETADQAALLTNMGCGYFQGYLFAKTLPPETVPEWISTYQPPIHVGGTSLPIDILSPILQAHVLRVQESICALRQDVPFPIHILENRSEGLCHLGCWLRGEGALRYRSAPEFDGILARHDRLHVLARAAKSLLDAGDRDGALRQGDLLEEENRLLLAELSLMTKRV